MYRFRLTQYWIGDQEKIDVKYVAYNWETAKHKIKRTCKYYRFRGQDWRRFGLEKGVPANVLDMWERTWVETEFPAAKEEREQREREKQIKEEAYWVALTMKMNEITAVIEKLLDKVETAANSMELNGFSPRDLKDLVGACEALQKMRNLEEGRPTSLTGKSTLTRNGLVERLMKLKDKGIPIEVDPRIFSFTNKNVQ